MKRWVLLVALAGLGCKTASSAGDDAPVTVKKLEVSFDADGRGEVQLELFVRGAKGTAIQAQWQLLLDGRPVGSGLQLLGQPMVESGTTLAFITPLPLPHANRDEGWRTVSLELSGELAINAMLVERWPFATRRQALVRGAPRP